MATYYFVHALPNAWLPTPGKTLVVEGVSAEDLAEQVKGQTIVSHVRYEDHAQRVSDELGIDLPASGINAPSPYSVKGRLVLAVLQPGTTEITYCLVTDGTDVIKEAELWF